MTDVNHFQCIYCSTRYGGTNSDLVQQIGRNHIKLCRKKKSIEGGERMNLQRYNKAIVAVVGGIIFTVLSHFGFTETTTLGEFVQAIVVAGVVYWVPNKG